MASVWRQRRGEARCAHDKKKLSTVLGHSLKHAKNTTTLLLYSTPTPGLTQAEVVKMTKQLNGDWVDYKTVEKTKDAAISAAIDAAHAVGLCS